MLKDAPVFGGDGHGRNIQLRKSSKTTVQEYSATTKYTANKL